MITTEIFHPRLCKECRQEIAVIIPYSSTGNAHGQLWEPCTNKSCSEFGKEVEECVVVVYKTLL